MSTETLNPTPTERRAAPKAERRQLAKAELLLQLASTADQWGRMLDGTEPGCLPPAEWGRQANGYDDPLLSIAATYRLTPGDLANVVRTLAEELETRAERAGYDRAWDWTERDGRPWPVSAAPGGVGT